MSEISKNSPRVMTDEESFAFREALRATQWWFDSIFLALGENPGVEGELREVSGEQTIPGGPAGIPQSKELEKQGKDDSGK